MNLIIGILLIPLGTFILIIGKKYFKSEPGAPTNSIDLILLGLAIISIGIGLIYVYCR